MLSNIVERERERVINSNVGLKPTLIMLFALLAVVGTILAIGFQNIASATPEQVNFNPVTIRNGAKIHVNGDKTLTAIDNGNKLFADNTNGNAVTDSQIASELNNFKTSQYGNDKISAVTGEVNLISESLLDANYCYAASTDSYYWLNDTKAKAELGLRAFRMANNYSGSMKKTISGQTESGYLFYGSVNLGSYGTRNTLTLSEVNKPSGTYIWSLNATEQAPFWDFTTNLSCTMYIGQTVYNNPMCLDDPENGYYSTVLTTGYKRADVTGKVLGSGGSQFVIQFKVGDTFSAGDVLYFGKPNGLKSTTGFRKGSDGYWNIYFLAEEDGRIISKSGPTSNMTGIYTGSDKIDHIPGSQVEEDKFAIRPVFDFTNTSISFIKNSISNEAATISGTFSDVPSSSASNNEDKKLVIKSAEVTITNSIADNKLSTEKSANNHAVTKYTNGVIYVPYGAKTLTIDSSAFNTNNANYISALANVNETQKYAVLGQTGEKLDIDLASIVNNSQVGSKATVSFYAEKANPSNTSDVISETPVTVEIEVVDGPEQTIRYDLGGGSGSLPSNATVKAGKSYPLADGSGLSKDGNPFSRWELTYTPYGETEEVTRLVKANEAIIVPDAANGIVVATAMYSGVSSIKSTDSKSSVVTVTWDTNAPEGTTARFTDSTGTYNSDRSIRYDKIKIAGSRVAVPGTPTLSVKTKAFDGWYDSKEGGNKVTISVTPTVNTTYYAHWLDGYKVTYNATGGTDAAIAGKFIDGTTIDEEIVLPGTLTVGPSKGTPVADDSDYMFYGWYNSPNGADGQFDETGTSFNELGGSKTVYAFYGPKTFLAPATSTVTVNPINISGNKYSVAQVQPEARDIATNGSTSQFYSKYSEWMNNDLYHLYTLLNGEDPNSADSWVEFRIVNVGQLDSDGTGLTFQAVHMLPTAYQTNSTPTNAGGWESSALRTKMQSGGEIYNMFDANLLNTTYNVTRNSKGKLWVPSYSELTGTSQKSVSSDGSQFAYWKGKVTAPTNKNSCLVIAGARSGGSVASIDYSGFWWERTPDTSTSVGFVCVSSFGSPVYNYNSILSLGIVPCLSL